MEGVRERLRRWHQTIEVGHLLVQFVFQGERLSLGAVGDENVVELFGHVLDAGSRFRTSRPNDAGNLRSPGFFHVNVDELLDEKSDDGGMRKENMNLLSVTKGRYGRV